MELLKQLYFIHTPSFYEKNMVEFIKDYCEAIDDCKVVVDETGNVLVTKGKSKTYPCIVAHTDEVHKSRPSGYTILCLSNNVIFGYDKDKLETCGIGADDKNGIWVALKMLVELPVLKCAFFVSEEVGCVGSSKVNMKFFNNCRYVVQCDRKGRKDFIVNAMCQQLSSKRFRKDCNLKKFGYETANGMMTDVAELKERGLGVSVVNLSCGYYNPHTDDEATRFDELVNCLNFVRHICSLEDTYHHKSESKPVVHSLTAKSTRGYTTRNWDDYFDSYYERYYDDYPDVGSVQISEEDQVALEIALEDEIRGMITNMVFDKKYDIIFRHIMVSKGLTYSVVEDALRTVAEDLYFDYAYDEEISNQLIKYC